MIARHVEPGRVLGAVKAASRRYAVAPQSGGASLDRTCARGPLWQVAETKKRLSNQTKKLGWRITRAAPNLPAKRVSHPKSKPGSGTAPKLLFITYQR